MTTDGCAAVSVTVVLASGDGDAAIGSDTSNGGSLISGRKGALCGVTGGVHMPAGLSSGTVLGLRWILFLRYSLLPDTILYEFPWVAVT